MKKLSRSSLTSSFLLSVWTGLLSVKLAQRSPVLLLFGWRAQSQNCELISHSKKSGKETHGQS